MSWNADPQVVGVQVGGSVVVLVMVILRAVQERAVSTMCHVTLDSTGWASRGGPGGPGDAADAVGKQPAKAGAGRLFLYSGLQVIG